MKLIPIITSIALCGLAFAQVAQVEEIEIGLPEVAKPDKPIKMCEGFAVRPEAQIAQGIEIIPAETKPQTEAIPKEYAEQKAVALKLEGLERDAKGLRLQVTLRLINPTDAAVVFTGYSEKSPLTEIHYWVDGKWMNATRRGFCGTGLRQCTIAPGQSAVIQAGLEGEKCPGRIGVAYTDGKNKERKMVWSDKIER